jgi:predicted transcriptional regulator
MHRGYIKVWRKIKDSFFYTDSAIVHLWIHLLLEANHKEKTFMFNGKKITLKKGQLITGRKKLSKETGIAESKIYRTMKMLESEQQIEQQTYNKYTIVTITNYNNYHENEQQNEQQTNSKRTADEHKQELKRIKEELKRIKEELEKEKAKKKGTTKKLVRDNPPTFEEWTEYCKEKGYSGIANKTYEYYQNMNWEDSQGNPLKNWKSKLLANWFKADNKDKQSDLFTQTCHICGKPIKDFKSKLEGKSFCRQECYNEGKELLRKGKL